MTRPTILPPEVTQAIMASPSIGYMTSQKLKASFASWSNRQGPIQWVQSPPPLRSMMELGEDKKPIAQMIDCLQTTFVLAVSTPRQLGDGLEPEMILGQITRAITTYAWHP